MLTGQMWPGSQKDVGSDLSVTTCFLRDLSYLISFSLSFLISQKDTVLTNFIRNMMLP